MNMRFVRWNWLLWPAAALIMLSGTAFADDCPDDIKAVTDTDVKVPVEVLAYQVKPLTKCELDAEAQAWLQLLKDKVTEISNAEVAAIYKKEEIKKTEQAESSLKDVEETTETDPEATREAVQEAEQAMQEAQDAAARAAKDAAVQAAIDAAEREVSEESQQADTADSAVDSQTAVKTALIKKTTVLMAERTALIDRFQIVLDELAAKGGDIEEYESYIKAVSGIKVDVTDASATWTTITGWLMSPEGGFRWAVNIIQFFVIVIVFYLLAILAGKAAHKAASRSKSFSSLMSDFLVTGTRRLVLIIGFFVGLSALEINIGPVLAVIGAAGFVIAFALQNSLSNFASGILMLIYRPFDTGDFVNVAGTVGKVETMNLLSTQLRTPDNQLVIVPNNSVWGDVITNITGITQRRLDMTFGIGYNDDIDKAQKILEDIVTGHELVLKDPETVVKLHELGDSSVNFVCRPWVRPDDYWTVYWYVTREVKRRFDAEGVSIPFPQRDVHIYQETTG
ncbi:MAG TPA: mechanosensitive ion channel domain-containing protein [Gammaproteobacteria bacterium]|nr:mechanosensitive ion channel domain-containing protein [Gammaproteobacteria bacterium]